MEEVIRTMFRCFSAFAIALSGCAQHDYSVDVRDPDASGPFLSFPETIAANFDISIDVAFQRGNFGRDVSRCQFQVAFYYYYQSDGLGEGEGDPDEGNPDAGGDKIDFPEGAGDCVYTDMSTRRGPDRGGGPGPHDNWQLRGSIDAGSQVDLFGQDVDLALMRREDGDSELFYELEGCSEESFPFGEIFDLSAPDARMGNDFEDLYLSEAIATGPMIEVVSPDSSELVDGKYYHSNANDFVLEWEQHGLPPESDSKMLRYDKMVYARNALEDQHRPMEALACIPSTERSMTIDSETLKQFRANPSKDRSDYYTAVQIDAALSLPQMETPWGEMLHSRTIVTDGGIVHLYSGE